MASDKVPVTITYRKPGTQPPLFVAGSFSDPPWEPQEMDSIVDDGEHTFKKEILASRNSSVQYKFRVGPGDWWILNEDAPTVTDDQGNKNNVIEVPDTEKDDGFSSLKHASKGPLEALKQEFAEPRSGASTPGFVRTAAEVADSAALLDKDPPDPEIPDDEAGRIGIRRLTATPIPEVAKTAAEVADTAEQLDAEEDTAVDAPRPLFAHEMLSSSGGVAPGEDHEGPPLFAYEFAGNIADKASLEDTQSPGRDQLPAKEYDINTYDLNDPLLVKFPASREEALDTIRKIETGLDEDRASYEGVPPSPVIGPGRSSAQDYGGDMLSLSPSASPIVPRAVRRLDIPKGSPIPETPDRSSSRVSLHSITEEAGTDEDDDSSPVVRYSSSSSKPRGDQKYPESDEDEGVELNDRKLARSKAPISPSGHLTPERAASPVPPDSPTEPTPNKAVPVDAEVLEAVMTLDKNDSTTLLHENPEAESPRIVVHRAEASTDPGDVSPVTRRNGTSHTEHDAVENKNHSASEASTDEDISKTHESPTTEQSQQGDLTNVADTGKSTGIEASTSGQVTKRQAPSPAERAATPNSIHSAGMDAAKNGNWFKAFFRLVFVDWIGGFLRRLFHGKPKALSVGFVATGAVLGLLWWRIG